MGLRRPRDRRALFFHAAVLGFAVVFAERLKPVRISLWRLRDRLNGDGTGHVVVCGLGETGFELADQLIARGRDVVVIDPDADPPAFGN